MEVALKNDLLIRLIKLVAKLSVDSLVGLAFEVGRFVCVNDVILLTLVYR
jgi:hypothetical protein